ncbi:hypothetical protein WQ56_13680 [Luteimonas sp. FCS-9]|nr:hypothetical protein WQ56_13680 [Luteimonas sp. FCS-9]
MANVAAFVWRGAPPQGAAVPAAEVPVAMPSPATSPSAATPPSLASSVPPGRGAGAEPVPGAAGAAAPAGTPTPVSAAPSAGPDAPPPLLLPVQGIALADVRDTYDDARGEERQHEALDIMAPAGTPVLAVADGTIEKLFTSDRGGLTIYQFEPTGTWSYYYAHLQAYAPGIAEGMHVRRGDVIGTVGSTGNADPTAPHLHFAVFRLTPERQWWTGEPVNPYPLLARS